MRLPLFLITFLYCFAVYAQDDKAYLAINFQKDLTENADAVLRSEDIHLDLREKGQFTLKQTRVVTILNSRGNRHQGAYAFYDDSRSIRTIKATIYNMLGGEMETFKKREFKDYSAVPGGTLYGDSRVLALDYTPTAYPYTLVFEVEYESETTAFLPEWIPVGGFACSTERSSYTVTFDPDEKIKIKESHLAGYPITSDKKPGRQTWEAKNLSAVRKEHLSPPIQEFMPYVSCTLENFRLEGVDGVASSWEAFGKWMDTNLLADTNDLSPETQTAVLELVDGEPDTEAKARKIYQYVQDKVRYISVQVGIGGWKPMNASDVDRLGYGDCKALTNYTKSLLEVAEIPSYYTIIYAGEDKKSLDTDMIGVQGNHVILNVPLPEKEVWLECTSQEVPFGYLGDFTDDRQVLMVTEDGGQLTSTPEYGQRDNLYALDAQFLANPDGSLSGKLRATSAGLFYGNGLALEHLDDKELKEHYHDQWPLLNGLDIRKMEFRNDRDSIRFRESLKVDLTNYLTPVNGDFILRPFLFTKSRKALPPRYSERQTPFRIDRGKTVRHRMVFQVPEGYRFDGVPEPITMESPYGTYHQEFKLRDDGTLECIRALLTRKGAFEPQDYESYRDFHKDINRTDNIKLLITNKT